jgi:hypothetical protein
MGRYVSYTEEQRALREGDWIDADELFRIMREKWNQDKYAVCGVSKARWFWAAWHRENDWSDSERPFASGYEDSKEAAMQKGREAVGVTELKALPSYSRRRRWFYLISQNERALFNQQMSDGIAAQYRRRLAIEARMQKPAEGSQTATLEFLYRFHTSDYDGSTCAVPHRIVKKTAKRIYVEVKSYSTNTWKPPDQDPNREPTWWDFNVRTTAVDRATLEREGCVRSAVLCGYLHVSPTLPSYSYTPQCLKDLGLSYPCTEGDVKRVFRRLSKEMHPDSGGDATRFIVLQQAYEAALEYVQSTQIAA